MIIYNGTLVERSAECDEHLVDLEVVNLQGEVADRGEREEGEEVDEVVGF